MVGIGQVASRALDDQSQQARFDASDVSSIKSIAAVQKGGQFFRPI